MENTVIFKIFTMLGCLGMFLYGMNLMSGGLQKLAGDSLRTLIAKMTSNRFKCVLTGIFVTALVQSSTATTLMLVSFVNAGLMALANAIGVIMGANIGTTVTAWMFALSFDGSFSLAAIAIPLMSVAYVLTASKKGNRRHLGQFFMGFALLFLGLGTLKGVAGPLLSSPEVQEFLGPITGFGFGSTLIFMVIGAAMTLMLQSSAATMSITMLLVANGVIPFTIAAAMVLGENIGTTITSNIAASVANVSAKRTARSHMLFNVFGVVWVLILFTPFLNLIGVIVESLGFGNPMDPTVPLSEVKDSLPYTVAVLHTLFNLINTFILIWFIPTIEKIVTKLVPSPKGEEKEKFRLKYIPSAVSTAEIALDEANSAIAKFGQTCTKGFGYIRSAIDNMADEQKRNESCEKLVKYEGITDNMEFEIATYLNDVSKGNISSESKGRIKCMYKIIGEMESLGDSGEAISRMIRRTVEHGKAFDEGMLHRLDHLMDLVQDAFNAMNDNLAVPYGQLKVINNALDAEDAINKFRNNLREEHISKIEQNSYNYQTGVFYMDLVSELEKIGDFLINISQASLASKNED